MNRAYMAGVVAVVAAIALAVWWSMRDTSSSAASTTPEIANMPTVGPGALPTPVLLRPASTSKATFARAGIGSGGAVLLHGRTINLRG